MKLIRNIKDRIRLWFLKRALKELKRTKKTFGYNQANTFGIMYDASTEENYRQIASLVKELQNDKKKVKTLGFFNMKDLPEYCFPQLSFEFCNAGNFAWNQKPKDKAVLDFIDSQYDVIIDLTPSDFFHIKYLMAISDASFKVGRFHEKYVDLYDLMIQIDDSTSQEETIKQTIFYLKMINNVKSVQS